MRFIAVIIFVCGLGACAEGVAPEPVTTVGETNDGRAVQRFTITRSNALGISPVSDAAIATQAAGICPGGYQELARRGEATRRISGIIYTDVTVTLVCL